MVRARSSRSTDAADDPLTRTLLSRALSRLGCVVEAAEDGQAAIDLLLDPPRAFDLITMDNDMPRLSGEDAVRRLRAVGRADFCCGITANALKSDQNCASEEHP